MPLPTQPLRDEHEELSPYLEQIRVAADAIGREADPRESIDKAYDFLAGHLLPHAKAEEEALYPEVARVMGAPAATQTMAIDHDEVERMTAELERLRSRLSGEPLTPEQTLGLRSVLYGLYTLVKAHFRKEEEVYLPLLDASLTAEEARALMERMEKAASEARHAG